MVKNITNITKILGKHLKRLSKDSSDAFIAVLCGLEPPRGINPIQPKDLEAKTPVEVAEIIMKFYTVRHGPGKVIRALKDMNENQIRMDLQKELRADSVKKNEKKVPNTMELAPGTSVGQISLADQKPNIGAGQQPSADVKRKRGRKPKTALGTSGGQVSVENQKPNVGASQQPNDDVKPKRVRKTKTAPGTSGGHVGVEDQKLNIGASQQPSKDVKPKRGRKPKTDGKHFVIENRNNLIKSIASVDPVLDDLLEKKLLTQEQYDIIRKKGTNQEKMRDLFDYVKPWKLKHKNILQIVLKKHNSSAIRNLIEKSRKK